MKRAQFLFSFALLPGIWGSTARAVCFKDGVSVNPVSSGPVISWEAEFRQAAVVVAGTVVSEKNIPDPKEPDFWAGTLYTLRVEGWLKGKAGKLVEVFSPNDSGRLPLTTGTRYLLFLRERDGHLTADACGNSAKLGSPFR
jgi:hypothetical protein